MPNALLVVTFSTLFVERNTIFFVLQQPVQRGTAAVRDHRDTHVAGRDDGHILRLS